MHRTSFERNPVRKKNRIHNIIPTAIMTLRCGEIEEQL